MVKKLMSVDFKKINIAKIRDDVNLILWNSGLGNMQTMKFTNKLLRGLKDVQIQINN